MAELIDKDCFDEESCRYFLREIGARVVPNYPFSYGMEEVHSLIIEHYGYEGIPDVTSVLQELLEEDSTATGIGDDGDIWRSWRHNWRHRNDNALDPFVPKVGNFILKQPTPKSLRRIKADNFLRKAESQQCHQPQMAPPPTPDRNSLYRLDEPAHDTELACGSLEEAVEYEALLTSATYSHQRCRMHVPLQIRADADDSGQSKPVIRESIVESFTSGFDSQQDFAEVTASMLQTDFDPSWLLSFEMLEPPSSLSKRSASLRGGQAPICTLQPIRSASPVASGGVEHSQEEQCSADDDYTVSWMENLGKYQDEEEQEKVEELREDHGLRFPEIQAKSDKATRSPCTPELIPKETSNDHYHGNATCVTPSETPEPQRRRTANRHARLIDGAIFPFKGRKSNAVRTSVDVHEALSPDAGRRSLFRLSWTPTRQNSGTRRSWLQGVRSIFRTSQNKQQNSFSKDRHNSSIGNSTDARLSMSKPHKRLTSSTASIAHPSQSRSLGLLLDGACDEVPSPSSSYLNKPLPLNPDEFAKSLSSGTRSTSIERSHTLSYQPHSASTTSTKISQTSSKREFQVLAKDLSKVTDITMYHPDLSPVHEARLNPSKYDPLKSPKPPYSPASFSSLAQRNPFVEDLVPLTPKPRKSNDAQAYGGSYGYATNGLPPSQSEPNLRTSSPIRTPHAAYYSPPNLPQTPPPSSPERNRSIHESSRGRSKSRGRANEEPSNNTPGGSGSPSKKVKRSRSPMKRLLGFGKDTPAREPKTPISAEPATPTAAHSTKKSSLKQWSDRIRHGFLSVDLEEIQREAEIEEYLEDASKPEPPSTFPISLDPAYQARLQADIELLICVSANKFLLHEAKHGRISKDTVNKIRRSWDSKNLPQVLEYHYDQATQRELILANFREVQFTGQIGSDPVALNSTMLSWGSLAKEMSVRTFCSADSAIKKQLHDAQRVLEMLSAPLITCLAFEQLHVKALAMMTKRQRERLARKQAENGGHTRNVSNVSKASYSQKGPYPRRDYSVASQYIPYHRRNLSEGSMGIIRGVEEETIEDKIRRMNVTPAPPPQIQMRKTTGAGGAVMNRSQKSSPSPSRYGRGYDGSRARYREV